MGDFRNRAHSAAKIGAEKQNLQNLQAEMRPNLTPTFTERLGQIRTPEVRHLVWALGSPPLMTQHKSWPFSLLDEDWFERTLARRWPWLMALDDSPEPLLEHLAKGPQLLGKRFERLLAFYFQADPEFKVLHAGWPIHASGKGKGGTIGEFDFLLKHLPSGQTWHLEVACKFYLAERNSASWATFKGPNAQDTLSGKMDKLVQQLALSDRPEAAAALSAEHIRVDERVLLLKGGLFHHISDIHRAKPPLHAHKNYPTGWWIRQGEWEQLLADSGAARIFSLSKPDWMGGPSGDLLTEPPKRPGLCARAFPAPDGLSPRVELDRGFIVPDKWPLWT